MSTEVAAGSRASASPSGWPVTTRVTPLISVATRRSVSASAAHAPARGRVDVRRRFRRKEIAEVGQTLLREHHDQIAVGVTAPEVVEIDLIGTAEQRQRVGHRPRRAHGRRRVGVGDDLHHPREILVAARVIRVRVRVDDGRHRPIGRGLDGLTNRHTPARLLRVNHHDAVVAHQGQRVAAAADEDVQDVAGTERPQPDGPVLLRSGWGSKDQDEDGSGACGHAEPRNFFPLAPGPHPRRVLTMMPRLG